MLLVLRLPLIDHPTPVHPDEESFMAALGFPAEYPVQHPGYPLWIALGSTTHRLGFSPYFAFLVWAMAASVVAPVLCYRLFRRFVQDGVAWWFALGFGMSPVLWFESVTALSYPAGAAFGVAIASMAIKGAQAGDRRWHTAAVVLLGLGMLVRGDLVVYLGPLVIAAGLRLRPIRRAWIPAAVLVLMLVLWLGVTKLVYIRGDEAVVAARRAHTVDVLLNTSVFRAGLIDGGLRNGAKIAANLAWDLGLATPFFIWGCWLHVRDWKRIGRRLRLVAFWIAPGLVFLLCFHVVQGYFLPLLPAAYLLTATALERRLGSRTSCRLAVGIALFSAAQFLFYPWSAQSDGWKRTVDAKIAFLSRSGLMQIDRRSLIHTDGDFWPTSAHGR